MLLKRTALRGCPALWQPAQTILLHMYDAYVFDGVDTCLRGGASRGSGGESARGSVSRGAGRKARCRRRVPFVEGSGPHHCTACHLSTTLPYDS